MPQTRPAAAGAPPDGPTAALPQVLQDALAAVVLVDLDTSEVVHVNRHAMAMSGDHELPLAVDEWGRRAGLVDPDGQDLADTTAPLSRVARGEPVAGALVRRVPDRASGAAADEQRRQQATGVRRVTPDAAEALWVTGVRLAPEQVPGDGDLPDGGATAADVDGRLTRSAMLVFLPVGGAHPDLVDDAALLHNRAVIATELSFTISDPHAEDDPLIWVNPAFTRVTGYTFDEVVGRNCRLLQGPGTDPATVQRMREGLARQETVVEVVLNYRQDGTAFWNELSLSPVVDAAGTLVNYVGIQSDVTARVTAEQARQEALRAERAARGRLALLSDVADALADLDERTGLRGASAELVRELLPWCGFVVATDGIDVLSATLAGTSGDRPRWPVRVETGPDPVVDLLRGRGDDVVDLDSDPFAHPRDGVTRWVLSQLAPGSAGRCLATAVRGRRGVLAVLVAALPDGGLAPEDADLLRDVVRRVGLSVENSRLHAREHRVAETLQRSMLPESVEVPGLDVWTYYAPGAEHAQVGGDWFDLLQPDDAGVGVVIGDVVGHDVEAAAAMGQLRSIVRAYAYEQQEPGEVLMRVDQLVEGMGVQRSASLVYARLEQQDDDVWELAWSRAGHMPPMVLQGGEVSTLLQPGGPMVGTAAGRRTTARRDLGPGDLVLLFTDGLVERRRRPLREGLARLERLLGECAGEDAAGVGERLLLELGDEAEDDLALVVVRVPPGEPSSEPVPPGRSRRWQLPGTTMSIARARRLVLAVCGRWDLPVARQAELVVSELVANAVLHGWGAVGLRLHVEPATESAPAALVVEVDDGNPRAPQVVEPGGGRPGGYGLRIVGQLSRWGSRPRGEGKTVWARLHL